MLNQHKILRVFKLIALLKKAPAKSTRNISLMIDLTERTVYRYIDLINEIGFEVVKDKNNKYSIKHDDDGASGYFSIEEAQLIKELLLSSAKNSVLKEGILKKLFIKSEIDMDVNHIIRANNGKMVTQINEAIQQQKQVILQKYYSANSNNISNRTIEPIQFTNNYQMLCAYEIASQQNKFFSVERMSAVLPTDNNFEFKAFHHFEKPDAFGFANIGNKKIKVDLMLNLRAFVILKEEYPLVIPFIIQDNKNKTYRLVLEVNDPKPITRFVLGLLDEISILGSEEFLAHLKNFVSQLTQNNKMVSTHLKKMNHEGK